VKTNNEKSANNENFSSKCVKKRPWVSRLLAKSKNIFDWQLSHKFTILLYKIHFLFLNSLRVRSPVFLMFFSRKYSVLFTLCDWAPNWFHWEGMYIVHRRGVGGGEAGKLNTSQSHKGLSFCLPMATCNH
jgi:hypothetical protein